MHAETTIPLASQCNGLGMRLLKLITDCIPHIAEWCDSLCTVRREGEDGWDKAVDDLLFTISVSGRHQ